MRAAREPWTEGPLAQAQPPQEPDWRCTACGEAVPPTLGLCWSCQRPRPDDGGTAPAPEGEAEADAPAPRVPAAPALSEDDAHSVFVEFVCVLLLFGAWRFLGPALDPEGYPPLGVGPLRPADTAYYLLLCAQSLALVWLVRRWRGEGFVTFGVLAPRWSDVPRGVLVFLGVLLADVLVSWWTKVGWDHPPALPHLGAHPGEAAVTVVGLLAAAVHEEILWRGYALHRLGILAGSRTPAVLLSAGLFGLLHYEYDAFDVFHVMVQGLVYAVAFLRYGRIGPVVVGHLLWNVYVSGWSAPGPEPG